MSSDCDKCKERFPEHQIVRFGEDELCKKCFIKKHLHVLDDEKTEEVFNIVKEGLKDHLRSSLNELID